MAMMDRSEFVGDINMMVKNGIKHTVVYTGRSRKVKGGIGNYEYISTDFSLKGLGFIRRVKNHILREKSYEAIPNIDYEAEGLVRINMDGIHGSYYDDVVELDLNKAYWASAHKIGVIDDEVYQEGLNLGLSKIELLASIGTMAKVVKQRRFDGKKYGRAEVLEDSERTKHIWDAVSWEVDKCMQECMRELGQDFMFYWTDAVFCKNTPSNVKKVERIVKKHGFTCKVVNIQYVTAKPDGRVYVWTMHQKGHAQVPLMDEKGLFGRVFVYIDPNQDVVGDLLKLLGKKDPNVQVRVKKRSLRLK